MRTTIRINDELLRRVKIRAAETDRTLAEVIEAALRKEIDQTDTGTEPQQVSIPTAGTGGVQPGVDLDDTSSLLDRMDGIS
ncbi:MAG: ribbon-helix-helix domain-containing protein [Spirochaetia bacterium]